MIEVRCAEHGSVYLKIFDEWISAEWKNVELLSDIKKSVQIPMPLLAFKSDKLVGGLSFTFYKNPEKSEKAIWINTVYIEPDSRCQGIASILIRSAETRLSQKAETELFVYTDKPDLYLKLNWEEIDKDKDNFVLKKRLMKR